MNTPRQDALLFEHHHFWRAQEKSLLAEVHKAAPGSIRSMMANIFYLAAASRVRLFEERKSALTMLSWSFYQDRADHLTREIIRS